MVTVNEAIQSIGKKLGKSEKAAFFGAFFAGLISHMSALVSDFPNHDGLASMYFDQNMITSGRWFLGAACAPSSYFSLPWLIGILSVFYIAVAAVVTVKILKVDDPVFAFLIATIVSVFPSLASNFAYVFTMDGYMLGMLLCVLAVRAVSLNKKSGWLIGAGLLAFGMGCYQSYICISMILCIFLICEILAGSGNAKEKAAGILKYFGMGAAGVILYYILLRVLLLIQGKELDTYQGINGMSETNGMGIFATVKLMYTDFFRFSFGKAVVPGVFAAIGLAGLFIIMIVCLIRALITGKLYRKPLTYVFSLIVCMIVPPAMNAILLISADVTYHVLMRYQWAFLIAVIIAVISRLTGECVNDQNSTYRIDRLIGWAAAVLCVFVVLSYTVADNIAYSNLNKKYEKTYAYCLRLADRIEETEGYYQGIPIAMVGVVGNDQFPTTDITESVTGALLGISGDYLLYKPENYRDFYKHYLGITFNILGEDEVVNFYNEDFYAEMESFPGKTSVMLHDGVIYVKTENIR